MYGTGSGEKESLLPSCECSRKALSFDKGVAPFGECRRNEKGVGTSTGSKVEQREIFTRVYGTVTFINHRPRWELHEFHA